MGVLPKDPQPVLTRAARIDRINALLALMVQPHEISEEDCWYACPKSGQCCDPDKPVNECRCGADDHNARLAEVSKEFALLVEKSHDG